MEEDATPLPWLTIADFEQFYKLNFKKMVVLCHKIIPDQDLSRQLVQEVFVKIWEKRALLHHINNPSAYLYQMVRFRAVDELRKRSEEAKELPAYASFSNGAYNHRQDELLLLILEASQQLPAKCKTIFEMAYFKGFSNQEIGAYLDLSPLTVKKQKQIALNKIKAQLLPAVIPLHPSLLKHG